MPDAARFAAVADELDQWSRDRDLAGAFLLTRGGEVLLRHAVGPADRATGTPVTPATRFGIASVTKMFTAVVVADLVSAGALAFDSAVVDLLPPERRPSTLRPDVTVHHLLCHQSGIADYCEEDEDSPAYLDDYGALWVDLPCYSMKRPVDFLPLFADLPPYRPPGERYQYSNAAFVLLGLVAEELTGRPYVELVQERVFDRAGMASSGFFPLDEAVPEVAVGYLPRADSSAPWRSNVYAMPVVGGADGGALCTVDDLDRFLRAYDDGTLLGDLREVMLTRHTEVDEGFHEGYGVFRWPDGRFGHGGGDPGVEAFVHRWPEEDVNLVVLCSMEGLLVEVRDLLVEAWRG
ncbi:MAG: serine hydrolase domain-containing protein [Marmoricola sp.]